MSDETPVTHVYFVYPYCDGCATTRRVRVDMLLPRPERGTDAARRWIEAARREGAAKFEREHAAECRGRRA